MLLLRRTLTHRTLPSWVAIKTWKASDASRCTLWYLVKENVHSFTIYCHPWKYRCTIGLYSGTRLLGCCTTNNVWHTFAVQWKLWNMNPALSPKTAGLCSTVVMRKIRNTRHYSTICTSQYVHGACVLMIRSTEVYNKSTIWWLRSQYGWILHECAAVFAQAAYCLLSHQILFIYTCSEPILCWQCCFQFWCCGYLYTSSLERILFLDLN